jgi:hypothetical protein
MRGTMPKKPHTEKENERRGNKPAARRERDAPKPGWKEREKDRKDEVGFPNGVGGGTLF